MNLQSTIRRDGIKVYYLRVDEEMKAKKEAMITAIANRVWEKILAFRVGKKNKTNQHRIKNQFKAFLP